MFISSIDRSGLIIFWRLLQLSGQNQQQIAEYIIHGLNEVYPDTFFSVYFNNIQEVGMANTPRQKQKATSITMEEAMRGARDEIQTRNTPQGARVRKDWVQRWNGLDRLIRH